MRAQKKKLMGVPEKAFSELKAAMASAVELVQQRHTGCQVVPVPVKIDDDGRVTSIHSVQVGGFLTEEEFTYRSVKEAIEYASEGALVHVVPAPMCRCSHRGGHL